MMELYTKTSQKASMIFLKSFSTSFSFSSLLFPVKMRQHIANIYGLVRIADEIVDTYRGPDSLEILNLLEEETYQALARGYSANPIVHSFVLSALQYDIDTKLIRAFFASMREDLTVFKHTSKSIDKYVYGSAEVIGLMCLKVFCEGNKKMYNELSESARSLGSVYQRVNFLRDLSNDIDGLGRIYFPEMKNGINEDSKNKAIERILSDLEKANANLDKLPQSSRKAVKLSRDYYSALLYKLQKTTVADIMNRRIRINNAHKIWMFVKVLAG